MIGKPTGNLMIGNALLIGACLIAVAGCSNIVEVHGYVPSETLLARIQEDQTSKDDVVATLGTPSVVSTFDSQTWYYVTKRTKRTAFLDPDILEQQVVAIHFDDADTVQQIVQYEIEDGMIIDPVSRETPTRGKELGILEQLLGNAGRQASQEQTLY